MCRARETCRDKEWGPVLIESFTDREHETMALAADLLDARRALRVSEERVAALEKGLAEYGKHHMSCPFNLGDPRCDCGLDSVLAASPGAEGVHSEARRKP
jgi:hypothetical protein